MGYKRLQEVTGGYKGLQEGYKEHACVLMAATSVTGGAASPGLSGNLGLFLARNSSNGMAVWQA